MEPSPQLFRQKLFGCYFRNSIYENPVRIPPSSCKVHHNSRYLRSPLAGRALLNEEGPCCDCSPIVLQPNSTT